VRALTMGFIREPGMRDPELDPWTLLTRITEQALRINERLLRERRRRPGVARKRLDRGVKPTWRS